MPDLKGQNARKAAMDEAARKRQELDAQAQALKNAQVKQNIERTEAEIAEDVIEKENEIANAIRFTLPTSPKPNSGSEEEEENTHLSQLIQDFIKKYGAENHNPKNHALSFPSMEEAQKFFEEQALEGREFHYTQVGADNHAISVGSGKLYFGARASILEEMKNDLDNPNSTLDSTSKTKLQAVYNQLSASCPTTAYKEKVKQQNTAAVKPDNGEELGQSTAPSPLSTTPTPK